MKKYWEINARSIGKGLAGWLIVTDMLIGASYLTSWLPLKLLVFISLSFLPGTALLRLLRLTFKSVSAGVLYSFGLSILALMLSGLAANQVLYAVGILRPLEFWGVFGAWNIVTIMLIVLGTSTNSQALRLKKWRIKKLTPSVCVLVGLSLLLPCMAMLGAFRLNNGGDALIAILTICYGAAIIVYAFFRRQQLPDGLIAWLIFIIGLSVLLMTSLRGWDIVGHDIEREFRVYTLAHVNGRWDVSLDRNPYNACLSITILPEMFARLLDVSGLVVFKVILQVIFAACVAVLYVLLRQYTSKLGAMIGSALFICYPTFINDSAMLTRQSVAYLFFALALLVMTNKQQTKAQKLLFLILSLGAILSHYSTAYMFVGLFAVAVIIKLWMIWWRQRQRRPFNYTMRRTVLSPPFAIGLFLMTFVWYAQITGTSNGLMITLQKSFASIPQLLSDDNKSSDTSTALLFAGGKTQADLYEAYLMAGVQPHALSDIADKLQYIPTLTTDDLPLTPLGERTRSIGIDPSLITKWRQDFAKVLQVLALTGVVYATYRLLRNKPGSLRPDFVCLSLAGIMLLALMVILPVLSINYGILRAFQQALIFLILPITLLLVGITRRFSGRIKTTVASVGIVVLFLLFTGLFAQMLGGVSPSLSLNNRGLYYGLYYSPKADFRAFAWLEQHVPKTADVRAANFNKAFMHDPDYYFSKTGILPSQIGANTYVYLDASQVQRQLLYTYHDSSSLIMTFPLNYYDDARNKIYSTGSTRIYQ